jgi:DNA polymerase I-like protein with 3'-5' exonuclease and polymerase domains
MSHDTDQNLPWFLGNAGIEAYRSPQNYYLVLDVETTNIEYGSAVNDENRLLLACWELVYPNGGIIKRHQWGDEYEMQALEEDIAGADFVVAHNAKFELQWLKRCGLELRDILVFDTMLAEWVIAGNRKWDISLDGTSKRYGLGQKLSLAGAAIKAGICPSLIPNEWLLPYCYKDVELCRLIFEAQKQILERDNLFHLTLVRNLTCSVLADIEFNGAELDSQAVLDEYTETLEAFRTVEQELEAYAGGINLSSPKQLAVYLFETLGFKVPTDHKGKPLKTGKGVPKTDVKTLALLKPENDRQQEFLKLYKTRNKYDSLISKNLEFFRLIVQQKAGVFRAILNQGFTQTHRLSSSGRPVLFTGAKRPKGAQGQNLPRSYKRLFTAHDPDYLVGEADGAQLEFRVAADMGDDQTAAREIIEGADIHSNTSKVMIEAGHPDFKGKTIKEGRQDAKAHTFAPMYGGQGKIKAEKEYSKFFRLKYHGISGMQERWTYEVLDTGRLITPYGMRFYWPGTKMGRSGYIDNTTSISNYPIQGFATGEIIPIALVHFWHRSRDLRITVWNTIHDSIASRIHKDDVDAYRELSKISLTTDVYNFLREVYHYEFHVPLGVGVKIGKQWGKSPFEEVWSVWPDGSETYEKKE